METHDKERLVCYAVAVLLFNIITDFADTSFQQRHDRIELHGISPFVHYGHYITKRFACKPLSHFIFLKTVAKFFRMCYNIREIKKQAEKA